MCGIFVYVGLKSFRTLDALKVLRILESEQEPDEKSPVGGHGAGIAYLNQRGTLTLTKVGKTNNSLPVNNLRLQLGKTANTSSCLVLSHVRQASPEFLDTITQKECTQPYQPSCSHSAFTLVFAHNGFVQNYQQLKNTLRMPHQFESLSYRRTLIDSEVIAHFAEEHFAQTKDPLETTHFLTEQIKGNNTTVILYLNSKGEAHLHAIHNGKTRGLIVWTNQKGEALICTREQPVEQVLSQFLTENNYQKIIKITRRDTANTEARFNIALQQLGKSNHRTIGSTKKIKLHGDDN